MGPVDYIIIAVVLGIVALAGLYIYRSRKSGRKCIGCPDSGTCNGQCSGNCSGCGGNCANK